MTYTPIMTVTVINQRLVEDTDLTKPLSDYVGIECYLVVEKNLQRTVLSIGRILTTCRELDFDAAIGEVFDDFFTDLTVAKYAVGTIPLLLSSGLYDRRLKVFNPLNYGKFEIDYTSVNTTDVINDPKKRGFLDDLVITSDEDMTHYLVSVNGVFHRTTLVDNKLYVMDGFRTIRVSGRRDVLVVDTKDLGGHTIIPLTANNTVLDQYNGLAKITATQSLKNKTIFPVIDGYFYHLDHHVLDVIADKSVRIYTNKLPLTEQFRHNPRTLLQPDRFGDGVTQNSRKYNDPYISILLDKTGADSAIFKTRDFQYSRLTHYHSFLVVLDNPEVYIRSVDITPTGTPKFYFDASNYKLSGMMSYGCGLCPSYLIWLDTFGRKAIFTAEQDGDVDRHLTTVDPSFIPSLITETKESAMLPAVFYDYVSA